MIPRREKTWMQGTSWLSMDKFISKQNKYKHEREKKTYRPK